MKDYLLIGQVVVSILLIIFVIMQNKGSALGGVFGGETNIYQNKRGIEKFLHNGTIVLAVLFLGSAIANLLI